jgi:hypothetical protein
MRYSDIYSGDKDRLADYLKELIKGEGLQEVALGVAKQFLAQGYESLSDKQKYGSPGIPVVGHEVLRGQM